MSGNVASGSKSLDDISERLRKLETTFQQQSSKSKDLSLNFSSSAKPLHTNSRTSQISRPKS